MRSRHSGTSVCTPIVFLCCLFQWACKQQPLPPPALQTVRAAYATELRSESPVRYSASIVPYAQVELAFKSGGLIDRLHQVRGVDGQLRDVQAGDKVAQGTVLATVRALDYQQHVDQSRQQVSASEAQLRQAETARLQAESDYARANNLYRTASLTRPEWEQAKTRLDTANAQTEAARAAVANARTVVEQAALSLADTSVSAPFTGWIAARNVQAGSLVGNSTVGFSLIDTHIVKAIFAVPDTALRSIRVGQRESVSLDALPQPVSGVISAISPQADPRSRVFTVEVAISNPRDEVRPGMIGSLTLAGGMAEATTRVVVPLSAVVRPPGGGANATGFAVFLLEDSGGKVVARVQPIGIGNTLGNSVEVTSGLSTGQRIVGLGGELLRHGQEVRVLQ